jgi:hypothetical protein
VECVSPIIRISFNPANLRAIVESTVTARF